MKNVAILIIITLLPNLAKADEAPLDSINQAVFNFLVKVEWYPFESYSNDLILEAKYQESIRLRGQGVFIISSGSSTGHVHFLLVDEDSFEIINMDNRFYENVGKFTSFFRKNDRYTRDDILYYLEELGRINRLNIERTSSHSHRYS